MSDQSKYLLIDIGNSRIKFVRVNSANDDLNVEHCMSIEEIENVIALSHKVLVACVGKPDLVEKLNELCIKHQVSCQVMQTQPQEFGIECAYEHYQNLGVDRWLAIIAARTMTELPVAILDLGTANTCDIVIGNRHVGGWIAPGFSLMKQSLLSNTQKVFTDLSMPQEINMGQSTPECVNYGCLAALQGFVLTAENYLASSEENYEILVTGGDQNLLFSLKNSNLHYFSNLVLRGLQRFL